MTDTLTTNPTNENIEAIISRIEKLWRKSADPAATDAEREAFQTKALALMERHRIEEAALQLSGDDSLVDMFIWRAEGRYAYPIIDIVDSIARAFGTRCYYYGGPYRKEVYVFGFRSDAERVKRLVSLLVTDALHQASLHRSGSASLTSEWRRSFLNGYASALSRRFSEARKQTEQEIKEEVAKSAALVLVSRKEQVNEAFSKRKLSSGYRSKTGAASSGYQAGREAAMRADTGSKSVSRRLELR